MGEGRHRKGRDEEHETEGDGEDERAWPRGGDCSDGSSAVAGERERKEGGVDVSVNRPKRGSRGQPSYDQTRRRNTTQRPVGKTAVRLRYVEDGAGRRRVSLVHTVAVGRVRA